jgi:hypothetical protein
LIESKDYNDFFFRTLSFERYNNIYIFVDNRLGIEKALEEVHTYGQYANAGRSTLVA